MGISRIGVLFAANADSLKSLNKQSEESTSSRGSQGSSSNDEAVVVSSSMTRPASPEADPARAARVQQIKEQVTKGSYRVDPAKLALAVVRDLG